MNTASLQNCKRLFELSRWGEEQLDPVTRLATVVANGLRWDYGIPQYDAGYLLRKLPQRIKTATLVIEPAHSLKPEGWWNVRYADDRNLASEFAENVEDALCLLAIKLFEKGVL